MYKITAPVLLIEKAWGLDFVNGVTQTDNEYLATKLEKKGYKVAKEESREPSKFDGFTVEQLVAYSKENNIDIGNATSANGIIKKITEAEKN